MKTREIDTTKIDSIKLPDSFKNGRVFVIEDDESLFVKKIRTPDMAYTREKLKVVKGKISEREIEQEVQAYRKSKNKQR